MLLNIVIVVTLCILSAFFSASESALFSLTRYQTRNLQQEHPVTGKIIAELLAHPKRTLVTILLGNTVANLALSALITAFLINGLGDWGTGYAIILTTFLLLIFSEVTPKIFAIRNAQRLSLWVSRPIFWFVVVLAPIRRFLQKVTDFGLLKLGIRLQPSESLMSQKDLRSLIRLSGKQGTLEKGEQQMIKAVFELGEIPVKETMTPRVEMVACDIAEGTKGVLEKVQQSHHIRIPIYEKTIDNIIGVVWVKELLVKSESDLKTLIHPVLFVPETMPIDQLFTEFRKQKARLGIVVDEYGGTSGIVTVEDVLEEIVGEIYDEYDQTSQKVEVIDADQLLVHGMTSLRELEERLETDIAVSEVETVGGLVLYVLGRFPKQGERVRYGKLEFVVEEVGKKRIHRIRVIRSDESQEKSNG